MKILKIHVGDFFRFFRWCITSEITNYKLLEIDTGAYIIAMSEENKLKYFPNDLYLTSNSDVQLNHIGIIKNLNVEFKNEGKSF